MSFSIASGSILPLLCIVFILGFTCLLSLYEFFIFFFVLLNQIASLSLLQAARNVSDHSRDISNATIVDGTGLSPESYRRRHEISVTVRI